MGNIKDVIDIDGTKRQLDIDGIVNIELRPVGAAPASGHSKACRRPSSSIATSPSRCPVGRSRRASAPTPTKDPA